MIVSIKIVCDSVADVPSQLVERYDIHVIPIIITMGNRTERESDISREEFWAAAAQGALPMTSQPPIGVFVETFSELVSAGHEVFCLTMTSKHSGTYNTACLAAREFGDRVRVVDSRELSYAISLQVELAAQLAEKGCDLYHIEEAVLELQSRIFVRLGLEHFEWVRRGGRLASVLPLVDRVSSSLKVRLICSISDGEVKFAGLARSGRRVLEALVEEVLQLGSVQRPLVAHTRRPEQAARLQHDLAQGLGMDLSELPVFEVGPGLASHSGDGLLAVACVRMFPEDKRSWIWRLLHA